LLGEEENGPDAELETENLEKLDYEDELYLGVANDDDKDKELEDIFAVEDVEELNFSDKEYSDLVNQDYDYEDDFDDSYIDFSDENSTKKEDVALKAEYGDVLDEYLNQKSDDIEPQIIAGLNEDEKEVIFKEVYRLLS
jgi:hypothetical protein